MYIRIGSELKASVKASHCPCRIYGTECRAVLHVESVFHLQKPCTCEKLNLNSEVFFCFCKNLQ